MKKFILVLLMIGVLLVSVVFTTWAAEEIKLLIWHDKGDSGLKMFKELGELFTKQNPNVEIESVSFPSQEFIQKSISSINTNSAPDMIWNDWHRIIPVEQQTKKLLDLTDKITSEDKLLIDKKVMFMGNYANKQVVYPNETTYIALGIRKSWLQKVNGKVPETIDEFIELGKKFVNEDPDNNGKNDTFGFTGYFGKGSLEFLRYFTLASGLNDITVNEKGEPTFNEATRKKILAKYASMYNTDKIVARDCVNHTYLEMYQLIEGGRVGMFRVGDWNLIQWKGTPKGDLILTSFPVLNKGDKATAQLYSMRGAAVPENSPHKDMAIKFAQFMNTKEAQQIHYKYQGGVIRTDIKLDDLSEGEKYFMEKIRGGQLKVMYPDTHYAKYLFVPKVEEIYEKAIQKIIIDKNADIDNIIKDAEKQANDVIKAEKK